MAILNMSALRRGLPRGQRLLGIDPGTRTIGIALSDVTPMLATPYGAIKRGKLSANAREIGAIAAREAVGGLVCGLPLSLDGSTGPAAQAARDWARALADQIGLDLAMWDERLSSTAVNRMLVSQADLSRHRRAALVDKLAAAYILQSALDASTPSVDATGNAGF